MSLRASLQTGVAISFKFSDCTSNQEIPTSRSALLGMTMLNTQSYDEDAKIRTPLSESCRKVQGSKQARIFITSELRTDKVGCAG